MSEDKGEKGDSGIQVYLRIRPSQKPSTYFQRDDIDLNKVIVKVPKKNEEIVNNSRSGYNFAFSGILDDKVTQREVFRTVGIPALRNALDGYNSTIFAYGQTGSGKTFTITGGPERYDDRGLIPRAIAQMFKSVKSDEQKGTSYSCFVSYLEIYNQSGYDLLLDNGNSAFDQIPKVTMLEDEDGNFHFKNLSMHAVSSEEDALNLLFLGDTNRAIAATEMNENSTRSHCIFTVMLERRNPGADTVTRSKLNIVDLAGSERVSRTSSAGQTLREAKYINSSLFFLEMVIVALHEKEKKKKERVHVPYRNSMMTSVLRDSLGGNCKTVMIATISPECQHTDESISTCHFAQRVALVKNSASVNEEVEPELVIQRLRAEVRRLREEVEFLSGNCDDDDDSNDGEHTTGTLPQHKMNELNESIQKYIRDRDETSHLDFCGGITPMKIYAVCSIFKKMLLQKSKANNTIDDDRGSSDGESSEESDICSTENTADNDRVKVNSCQQTRSRKPSENKTRCAQQRKNDRAKKLDTAFGVPICTDKRVLDEPNAAFSWFKDHYPYLITMDRNKNSLKLKYAEAKKSGRRIDEIRSRISSHKESIEKLRKNHAISSGLRNPYAEETIEGGMTLDEKFHCDAIDKEKAAYKETLAHLRGLKGEIEETQTMCKKDRLKLQSDFDKWYHRMCNEESPTERPPPPADEENFSANAVAPMITPTVIGSNEEANGNSGAPPSRMKDAIKTPEHAPEDGKRRQKESQDGFKLPPGIQLTGNAEADADIIAFFKAKEVLLSKSSFRR